MTADGRSPVLIVSQLPPPLHGSTVMTQHLVDSVQDLGHEVVVVERRFSRTAHAVGRPSVTKALAVPSLVARLTAAVRRERPASCVFFLTNRPGSFLVDRVLLGVLRMLGVPTILYVHTSGYRALADRGAVWRRLLLSGFGHHRVVVLGDSLIEDVLPFTTRARISVVPNTTEPPPRAEHRRAHEDEPLHVVQLSNLDPEKGADTVVRLAGGIDRAHVARFSIAGGGSAERLSELREEVERTGGAVRLLGLLEPPAKWRLLESADVLLFPSTYRYEAQPLTIIEAMSLGVPVVAYDVGGVRDLVEDGVTGRLVTAGDEDALAGALETLRDPSERTRLGEGARDRYTAVHSPDAYRTAWKGLLDG